MGWNSSSSKIIDYMMGSASWQLDWRSPEYGSQHRLMTNVYRGYDSVLYTLSYNKDGVDGYRDWDSMKNYQIITNTKFFCCEYQLDAGTVVNCGSFSIDTTWGDKLLYYPGTTPSTITYSNSYTQSLYHYSSPNSNINSDIYVLYEANGYFGTFSITGSATDSCATGIVDFTINEIDFNIQGFAYYRLEGDEYATISQNSLGWLYKDGTYSWYDRDQYGLTGIGTTMFNNSLILNNYQLGLYPVGGDMNKKTADIGYRLNNYIAKYIPYSFYNLEFVVDIENGNSNKILKMYIGELPPPLPYHDLNSLVTGNFSRSNSILIKGITESGTYSFYNLRGNQYLYLVGPYIGLSGSNDYVLFYIKDIKIDGLYNDGNNRLYIIDENDYTPTGLTEATYSYRVSESDMISSKIGNGTFDSGIWENGVWNSGWREDNYVKEFYDVYKSFNYLSLTRWRIQITGPTSSVYNFEIGDKVSIGNIVAIDINNNRKVIKKYFTIINKDDNNIIVEFDSDFPIRRIERDSIYHRIYITKNIWMSGAFLNGYFSGVWNYGLFKGYPLITEMYDSQWIDGIFDGGHFKSIRYETLTFSHLFRHYLQDTITSENIINLNSYLGLSFSNEHGLTVGDKIIISKDDKSTYLEYDGETSVISVINNNQIVTDKSWTWTNEESISLVETGSVHINLSTGLIQKVTFNSNNISNTTSKQTYNNSSIFTYNSWMDVIYSNNSAVNIGKPDTNYLLNPPSKNFVSPKSKNYYCENNLYGYPTFDILESNSSFRDSYSPLVRQYRLGVKYKIYRNLIGDSGLFEDYFNDNLEFEKLGWDITQNSDLGNYYYNYYDIFPSDGNKTSFASYTYSVTPSFVVGQKVFIESTNYPKVAENWQFSDNTITIPTTNDDFKQITKISSITYSKVYDGNERWIIHTYLDWGSEPKESGGINEPGKISEVNVEFKKTTQDDGFEGNELKVEAYYKGGVLNLSTPEKYVPNRDLSEIDKSRYTIVEFNLLTYSNVYRDDNLNYSYSPNESMFNFLPKIHFNNINSKYVNSTDVIFSYLPIYKNIDHLLTTNSKKIEYFYNKKSLSMYFRGEYSLNNADKSKISTYIIDNLSFYEVDMIPFFQYFTDSNINKSIQVPYQAISPYIDYKNELDNFIDQLKIGLDSISVVNTFVPLSGVGVGIGAVSSDIIYRS